MFASSPHSLYTAARAVRVPLLEKLCVQAHPPGANTAVHALRRKVLQALIRRQKDPSVRPSQVSPALTALAPWSGTLSSCWVSILPQIGLLPLRDFSKESEHFLG